MNDRRGWWADMPLPLASASAAGDLIGSRLWLLSRRKVTEQTRLDAMAYTQEALQWLIDDGIAARIDVSALFRRDITGWLDIAIAIYRTDAAAGRTAIESYTLAWSATLGVPLAWSCHMPFARPDLPDLMAQTETMLLGDLPQVLPVVRRLILRAVARTQPGMVWSEYRAPGMVCRA
jgi:phage gp46-like protein